MKISSFGGWVAVLLAAVFMAAGTGLAQDAPAVRAPLAKMELKPDTSIVFLGDSITHQCLYTQYVEDYLYTRFPKQRFKIHNAGVGGARASDALARFDRDVAGYKPDYVTVLLGMNDGSYRPYDEQVFQTYRKDMTKLVEQIVALGAKPILITPTMFDARAVRANARRRRRKPNEEMLQLYNSVLGFYGSWLREVATTNGHGFVDMYGPLNNLTLMKRKQEPGFTLIPDSVHPAENGQVVMAVAIITDMQLPKVVSNVTVNRNGNKLNARARGGKVSAAKVLDDGGIEFAWLADSLPWVLPEKAALGVDLTKLGHRLSREGLQVRGLPGPLNGKFKLTIDDAEIGTFTKAKLLRMELQRYANTPQYQQAAKVAALNKARNEGPVRALRGEWSRFQRYDRLRRRAKSSDNANLAKQLAAAKKAIEGMDERVADAEKAARKIEDQIFAVNQPQKRVYTIRPVK